MTVDGVYSERWKTVGRFNLLASRLVIGVFFFSSTELMMVFHSVGILAGSDGKGENEHLNRINNLVGCLKKVKMFQRVFCAFFPMMMVVRRNEA